MVQEIQLTNGGRTLVDDDVYAWAKDYLWSRHPDGHACGSINGEPVRLHRAILDAPIGVEVDHINCDPTDNRRENLRLCTRSQNCANQRKMRTLTSRYKGVSWHKHLQRWRVVVGDRHIGYFDSEDEAALVYNAEANATWGEYARLNVLGQEPIQRVKDEPRPYLLHVRKNGIGFRGISRNRARWRARIQELGKEVRLGTFDTPEEAARAYDAKAKELFGSWAILNFPDEVAP